MKVYSCSQARQRLASLLDEASRDGSVRIRRRDGGLFEVAPVSPSRSALDIPGLSTDIDKSEIVSIVREGRRRSTRQGLSAGSARRNGRARRRPKRRAKAGR